MQLIREMILLGIGLAGGLITAGGTFALITVVGIVPRMAGATQTASHIRRYETAIILGGTVGNLVDQFGWTFGMNHAVLALAGLGSGVFVGSLVMALAETLNVMPIFCRRLRLDRGVSWLVTAIAAGKCAGALLFFTFFC